MTIKQTYQSPEIVEMGLATDLTNGMGILAAKVRVLLVLLVATVGLALIAIGIAAS